MGGTLLRKVEEFQTKLLAPLVRRATKLEAFIAELFLFLAGLVDPRRRAGEPQIVRREDLARGRARQCRARWIPPSLAGDRRFTFCFSTARNSGCALDRVTTKDRAAFKSDLDRVFYASSESLGAFERRTKAKDATCGEENTYRILSYVALTLNGQWRKYLLSAGKFFAH